MVDVCYDVCKDSVKYFNVKDTCQWADSPRWIYDSCCGAMPVTCKTCCVTYHEWNVWAWGPSLTNEFEVIEDDLVKKY